MFVPLTPLEFRRRAVHLYGEKTGIVDGPKRFTYRHFHQRSRRLAWALRNQGIRQGEVVSFITTNTHHLLEGYYGVVESGAVLNPINVRVSAHEIEYILNHAESKSLIYHSEFRPLVEAIRSRAPGLRHLVELEPSEPLPHGSQDYEEVLAGAGEEPLPLTPEDENEAAELFYTSGTTGLPKGVVLSHRALYLHTLNFLATSNITDQDALLHVVPLFHVNGWGTPHTVTAVGGKHVMLRKAVPAEVFRLIQEERVTRILAVPAVLRALLAAPERRDFDVSSLKLVMVGGAPASLTLIRSIEDQLGCQAVAGYGLTETAPVLTIAQPKAHMMRWAKDQRRAQQVRTGTELIGVQLRVIAPEGRDVARDDREIGQIVVRSNVVMTGYHKDPEATGSAIRGGWFHTGDLATVDAEGSVRIVDRSKEAGGHRGSEP